MILLKPPFISISLLLVAFELPNSRAANVDLRLYSSACLNDEQQSFAIPNSYRSCTDDSFGRVPEAGLVSESTIQLSSDSDQYAIGDLFCVPLTFASLSQLEYTMSISAESDSPSLTGLLLIKKSSSMKSLSGATSDAATENWFAAATKTTAFSGQPISEAPTESNSTATSSAISTAQIPENFRKILEIVRFTESLLEYLEPTDVINLLAANSAMSKFLKDHVKTSFNSEFPSLKGISRSLFSLMVLRTLLNDPQIKFKDWHHIVHPASAINLNLFINYRLENVLEASEHYALVNLIEFIRSKGLLSHAEQLPRPLSVFFSSKLIAIPEFKSKMISVVMKAAQYGHLRILVSLFEHIKIAFPDEIAGFYILDIFLLGTELRKGVKWTALQRSVHAPTPNVANFLFHRVAEDESVLNAYHSRIAASKYHNDLPSFWERLIFPLSAQKKLTSLLKFDLLKKSHHSQVRAIHLALRGARNLKVLSLFLGWEREFIQSPIPDHDDVQIFYQLAFSTKSLECLNLVKKAFPSQFNVDLAFIYDWPMGFRQSFNNDAEIRSYITRNKGILHTLAKHGSVNVLQFIYKEYSTREKLLADCNRIENGKSPLEVALEGGKWEMFKVLVRHGAVCEKKFLVRVLEVRPQLLDDILPDQLARETFAYNFISQEFQVTLLEWSILCKKHEALQWFLANLPLKYWRKFDGAGNTPIHLAVISGNCVAIKLLLNLDPSLINVLNQSNATPMDAACRLREKVKIESTISVVNESIEILALASQNI